MKFFPPFSLELTLALVKPHASKVPYVVKEIKEIIRVHGFYIVQYNECIMDTDHASVMYAEHKGKPFYDRLIHMMTSGPINSFVLAREDAIKKWREVMGPTRTLDAQFTSPTSLRGMYGLSNTRNATHGSGLTRTLDAQFTSPTSLRGMYGLSNTRNATPGSDSPPSVFKEVGVFFPSFDICDWYDKEEEFFRNGYVKYCEESGIHVKDERDAPSGLHQAEDKTKA